ncbi:MAG: hypothetical protein DWQ07_16000 [Chloroflexi bacterium]|nr:MAG: hypothetical protein DWQ07_16000 [Chloroflexota bacterium]MBL1195254.1 hypothetical protein [Chloroflexota bacterium]NOH12540.1 hypothetical protein [Chloroflexota bacterium]
MNSEIREILTDLKAAARIGHADSLNAALDLVAQLDPVASNQSFEDGFIEQVLLPLGSALNAPLVPDAWLGELVSAPLAALRAMAAVALTQRYRAGNQQVEKELSDLSKDERADVRQCLVTALRQTEGDNSEHLFCLAQKWLQAASARTRACGLGLLSESGFSEALPLLETAHTDEDPDVRRALVDALLEMAARGHGQDIMQMLTAWTEETSPNVWVITKTLAGSWAVDHLASAEAILDKLAADENNAKRVESGRKALARHHNK